MPNIPNIPDDLQHLPGVSMNPPPADIMQQTLGVIGQALANANMGDEDHAKLVWIANRQNGQTSVNAAFVMRKDDHIQVAAWIGKTWGEPIAAGVAGSITW